MKATSLEGGKKNVGAARGENPHTWFIKKL